MKKLFISIFAIFLIAQSVSSQEKTGVNLRFEVNKTPRVYLIDGDHYVVFRDDKIKGFFEPIGLYNMQSGKIAGPGYEEPTWYQKASQWYLDFFSDKRNKGRILLGLGIGVVTLITLVSLMVAFIKFLRRNMKVEEYNLEPYNYEFDPDEDEETQEDSEDRLRA